MYEAAERADIEVLVVSFKGSVQALRNWERVHILNPDRFSSSIRESSADDPWGWAVGE